MMHPEERREAWIRRRAEWWANRRLGGCSEDVWDLREYAIVISCVFLLETPDNLLGQSAFAQFSKGYHGGSYERTGKVWSFGLT